MEKSVVGGKLLGHFSVMRRVYSHAAHYSQQLNQQYELVLNKRQQPCKYRIVPMYTQLRHKSASKQTYNLPPPRCQWH